MDNSGGRAAIFAALVVTVALGGAAVAQEPPGSAAPAPLVGASVGDAGWWNRLRPQVDLPTGQPPAPPVPGVPAGALVVAASIGDPAAVAAVDIDPDHPSGATIESFVLTLREVDDDGANLNTPFAAIVACPVTGYWVGGDNGVWETRPEHDCDIASAPGARADDGTWTFDLRALGQLWSDGTVAADGVALVEATEAPTSFRTAFAGLADLAIGVEVVASGGDEPGADPFAPPAGGATSPLGGSSGGVPASPRPGSFRPPAATPTVPATPAPAAPAATGAADPLPDVDVPGIPIAEPGSSPLGSLPWWTWPLLAVVLVLSLLAMVALGPAGEPLLLAGGRGVTSAIEARMKPEEP